MGTPYTYTGFLCEYSMPPPPSPGQGHLITWARAPRCPQCTTAFGAFDRKNVVSMFGTENGSLKSTQYYLGRPDLLFFIAEPGQGAPLLVTNPTDSIWLLLRQRNYLLFETPSSCWPVFPKHQKYQMLFPRIYKASKYSPVLMER